MARFLLVRLDGDIENVEPLCEAIGSFRRVRYVTEDKSAEPCADCVGGLAFYSLMETGKCNTCGGTGILRECAVCDAREIDVELMLDLEGDE